MARVPLEGATGGPFPDVQPSRLEWTQVTRARLHTRPWCWTWTPAESSAFPSSCLGRSAGRTLPSGNFCLGGHLITAPFKVTGPGNGGVGGGVGGGPC